MQAVRQLENSPAMRAVRHLENFPDIQAVRQLENSPAMRAVRRLATSPAMLPGLPARELPGHAGHHAAPGVPGDAGRWRTVHWHGSRRPRLTQAELATGVGAPHRRSPLPQAVGASTAGGGGYAGAGPGSCSAQHGTNASRRLSTDCNARRGHHRRRDLTRSGLGPSKNWRRTSATFQDAAPTPDAQEGVNRLGSVVGVLWLVLNSFVVRPGTSEGGTRRSVFPWILAPSGREHTAGSAAGAAPRRPT